LDHQLELAWLNLKVSGTRHLQAVDTNHRADTLSLKTKEDNLAGLEIADAIVTPIARSILDRQCRIDVELIKSKMHRGRSGEIDDHGLVVLPKK